MQSHSSISQHKRSGGFSLIEILVAMLISVIGILGMLALQARAQQAQFESYQRTQALLLVDDMINRIRANPTAIDCYDITTSAAAGTPFLGTGSTVGIACASGTANAQAIAVADMTAWHNNLLGAGETLGGGNVGSIVGARGCILNTAGDIYLISVTWQGQFPSFAPAAGNNCARTLYDTTATEDFHRRVVSTTVEFADLSS